MMARVNTARFAASAVLAGALCSACAGGGENANEQHKEPAAGNTSNAVEPAAQEDSLAESQDSAPASESESSAKTSATAERDADEEAGRGFEAVSGDRDSYIVPDDSPLPPGAALDISSEQPQPGEYFNFQVCSAAYSFSLDNGKRYAVTASHCGKEGDTVWAGQQDRSFRYPADPIGHVVYSDLYAEGSHQLDVALIELTGEAEYYTPSASDTAVAESLKKLPEEVCKLGRTTEITCGDVFSGEQTGTLNTKDEKLEATAARAHICAKTGDSGGPVYTEINGTRVIVGIVSGTTEQLADDEECTADADVDLSFTPIVDVQRVIEDQLGRPAGQVIEGKTR